MQGNDIILNSKLLHSVPGTSDLCQITISVVLWNNLLRKFQTWFKYCFASLSSAQAVLEFEVYSCHRVTKWLLNVWCFLPYFNVLMEDNHTNLILEYNRDIAIASLPVDILLSVVLVVGIIGNVFVIFIFATKMRKDQRGSRYFIPIVAFFDLLVCVLSLIYFISTTLHWTTFRSDELCKTMTFFLVQTMMISDAFLLAISVQRFIKICRPAAKQMTLYWRRVTVVLVIATNTLYSIPTAVVSGVQDSPVIYRNVNITGKGCSTTNNEYSLFQLIYYGVVMFILVTNIAVTCGLYTPIACIIYRRSRNYRFPATCRNQCALRWNAWATWNQFQFDVLCDYYCLCGVLLTDSNNDNICHTRWYNMGNELLWWNQNLQVFWKDIHI